MRLVLLAAAAAALFGCATAPSNLSPQEAAVAQKQRDELHRTMQEERRVREYEDWQRWHV